MALLKRFNNNDEGQGNGRPPSKAKIRVGQSTSIGNFRDNNEDRMYVDQRMGLYIVADGMGGQAAGEQASQLAVEIVPQYLRRLPLTADDPQLIREAVHNAMIAANEAIIARGIADPTTKNMGTTEVMVLLRNGRFYVANIGDSRVYLLRRRELFRLTTDHNLAWALFLANNITKEQLKDHKFKNVLWKYLGSKEAFEGPDLEEVDVEPGDRILMATDGLTGEAEDEQILAECLRYPNDPQRCADHLVNFALQIGSKDNVTCVVLDVDSL